MKANTIEQLRIFGFSEKEVKVYLALLELDSSIVSKVAKNAGVNRSTAYVILESLSKRGLVTSLRQRGATLYTPTPPEQLVRHLEEMAKQYSGFATIAQKLIPDLKSLQKAQEKKAGEHSLPKVQLYEGAAGMRTIYEETLASLEHIRAGVAHRKDQSTSAISADQFKSIPTISVNGDKIILVSPEENFAAVVESHELSLKLKKILESSRKELRGKKTFLGGESAIETK